MERNSSKSSKCIHPGCAFDSSFASFDKGVFSSGSILNVREGCKGGEVRLNGKEGCKGGEVKFVF